MPYELYTAAAIGILPTEFAHMVGILLSHCRTTDTLCAFLVSCGILQKEVAEEVALLPSFRVAGGSMNLPDFR